MANSMGKDHKIKLYFFVFLIFSCSIASIGLFADSGNIASDRQTLKIASMFWGLAGGLALFLFGMEQMSSALKMVAGDRMKGLLAKLTTNRFAGASTGAFVTAIIQSSSVTTVLVVGFITAEVMTLSQAIGVIFGANVGTTITAQIVAFKVTKYALAMIALGFGMLFSSKDEKIKHYGEMLMGLGLVFYGMSVMSSTMKPLRSYQPFLDLMRKMENPLLGIGVSAIFTGLVQSSSATTGIIIVMASQGLITLPAGIALIFGANVGTCVTALLASIGKPTDAVRAGMVHVLFNMVGVLLWVAFIKQLSELVVWMSPKASLDLTATEILAKETPRQIANAHTVFNIVNTLVFLPFTKPMATLVMRLVPGKSSAEIDRELKPVMSTQYINDGLLSTPVLALEQAKFELVRMAEIVRSMLVEIMPAFTSNDVKIANEILKRDNQVDFLQSAISNYLIKVSRKNLSLQLSEKMIQNLQVAGELEHIGDLIEKNLVALLLKKSEGSIQFSDEGRDELIEYHRRIVDSYDMAIEAFAKNDLALARTVATMKPELMNMVHVYRRTHYSRLSKNLQASISSSQIHLDLVDYLRRLNAYTDAIAQSVMEVS